MKTTVYLGKRQPTVNFSCGAHAFAFSGQRGYSCISEKSVYCAESFTKFERRSQDLSGFLGAGEEEDFAFAKTLGSPCSKAGIFSSAPSATLSREKRAFTWSPLLHSQACISVVPGHGDFLCKRGSISPLGSS